MTVLHRGRSFRFHTSANTINMVLNDFLATTGRLGVALVLLLAVWILNIGLGED